MSERPRIIIFDSGVGGLTVLEQVRALRPDANLIYAADTAAFPYGAMPEDRLIARVLGVAGALIERFRPDVFVVACNTASTLALSRLRETYDLPFVGTVPAIKVAAETTVSGVIGVLSTPATAEREYTRELITSFADGCRVELVGARDLAGIAERKLSGGRVSGADVAREIAPAFVEDRIGGKVARTDVVVLACTHFPFLGDEIAAAAPWPVKFIDPAPAIAQRVVHFVGAAPDGTAAQDGPRDGGGLAVFTDTRPVAPELARTLARIGITAVKNGFG